MEQMIQARENVSMEALSASFGVSMQTVRRDVSALIANGTVKKVYGGVRAVKTSAALPPFEIRSVTQHEEKVRIAARAAREVMEGDVIFVDSGTTTMHMIEALRGKSVTIVTHSLGVIRSAAPYEEMSVIVLPGTLQRRTNSFTGQDAINLLKGYHMRWAFMAATGISMHGVTNSSPLETEIKRAAMAQSERTALLVDSKKFGHTALLTYAMISDFDAVFTGAAPSEEYLKALSESGAQLIIAD